MTVMESEGLEKLTLRRLATELDTGPASLYVYFHNVADLHAAVLDELLATVDLGPVRSPGGWRERFEAVLWSYIRVLMQYPPLARSALLTRPSGPFYLDLVEALATLLHEGGVEAETTAWAVDLLMQVATATGAEQATRQESPRDGVEWEALVEAVENADSKRYPHIRDLGQLLLSGTGTTRTRWALSVLLNGIVATAPPTPAPASSPETNIIDGERS
ncbi:TetR/AcrR family transcriptional regulator C-terminal domain-containing protein [Gordonia humi]